MSIAFSQVRVNGEIARLVNREMHGDRFCGQMEPTFSCLDGNTCILNLGLATALTVVLALFTVANFSGYLDICIITK